VRNSIAAGRRLAARLVLVQLGVSLLVALLFLAQGLRPATGAFAGGMLVTAGTALFATRVFSTAAPGARSALFGFIAGTLLKWMLVCGGMYALLVFCQLPVLPVIAGLCAALLANLVAWRFKD